MRFVKNSCIEFPDGEELKTLPVSEFALGQLCTKTGVPAQYIKKCIAEEESLARDNMNTWIPKCKSGMFIREYDGEVRGILSPRYSACDTPEILSVLADAGLDGYSIKGHYLSETFMNVRFIGNRLNIDGEDLFSMVSVISSDVGRAGCMVVFGIYKQVCTNGLVIMKAGGTLWKQRHIGIDPAEFRKELAASVKTLPELTKRAEEMVRFSAGREIDPERMENIIRELKLSEESRKNVINLTETRYGRSEWGFINSLTEEAQKHGIERRLEIESFAGKILAS